VAAPAPVEERAASTPAPALELAPSVASSRPPAPAADEADAAIEFFATDPGALEGLEEHQAGMSARSKAAAEVSEAELADDGAAATEPDGGARAPAAAAAADALAGAAAEEAEGAARSEGLTQDVEAPDLGASAVGDEQRAVVEEAEAVPVDGADAVEAVAVGEAGPERWLVVIGGVLVLGGGAVLLLAWVARRRRDPLLR
jgi:hypothetical protein